MELIYFPINADHGKPVKIKIRHTKNRLDPYRIQPELVLNMINQDRVEAY